MHRPTTPQPLRPLSASLRFGTAPRADEFAEPASRGETRLKPGFLAASEDGFIFGAKGQPGTVVTVPGAVVTARWWS
jgi:hypothetical protein